MRKHTISFKNAFIGIYTAIITQVNMRIHFTFTSLVLILAVWLKVSITEALVLVLTISSVLVAEMGNTAIEFLADTVTLEKNEGIKHAKDIAAGGVLIAAIFSVIVGVVIFLPKLLSLL